MFKERRSLFVLVVLSILAIAVTGCGRKRMVTINGDVVKVDEFNNRVQAVPVQTSSGQLPAGAYVMQQIIQEKVIQQLAKEKGLEPTEDQVNKKIDALKRQSGGDLSKTLAQSGMTMDSLRTKIKIEQSYVNLASKGVSIPDDEVKKTYQQLLNAPNSQLKRPARYPGGAIVAKSKANIDKAYSLLAGGTDFGTVAMQVSEDPGSKAESGHSGMGFQRDAEGAQGSRGYSLLFEYE